MKTVAQIVKENPGMRYLTAACGFLDRVDPRIKKEVMGQLAECAYPCFDDVLYIETTGHVYLENEMLHPDPEHDVILLYKAGKPLQKIADELNISIHSVKYYAQKAYRANKLKRRKPLK